MYDWRPGCEGPPRPQAGVLGAFDWLFEMLEEVERCGLWLPSWGAQPSSLAACGQRLHEVLAQAPTLILVYWQH